MATKISDLNLYQADTGKIHTYPKKDINGKFVPMLYQLSLHPPDFRRTFF
ncbi:MAG: hypothetical protein IJ730_04245 [Alphaproteobacteria bacterium]|nr:hypothetical protein [Alphaproteobacteria bacterium]